MFIMVQMCYLIYIAALSMCRTFISVIIQLQSVYMIM